MTKLKKLKLKFYGVIALALALGVTGAYGGVKAYQSYNSPRTVIENVENYNEAVSPEPSVPEDNLGAVSVITNPLCINGLCTYVAHGRFTDASTSLFTIISPNLVASSTATGTNHGIVVQRDGTVASLGYVDWLVNTTTVTLAELKITNAATSSFTYACGATALYSGSPTVTLIPSSTVIATHTMNIVLRNFTTSTNAVDSLQRDSIYVSPARPFFTCKVDGSLDSIGNNNNAFTNTTNTFDGYYTVKMEYTQN